jgi:hypothetical protein
MAHLKKIPNKTSLVSDQLKKFLKEERTSEGEIYVRLHRAISWFKSAEEMPGNEDMQFISLWISLNACYAIDNFSELNMAEKHSERKNISSFLAKLVEHDSTRKIHDLLWNRFSSEVRLLLENKFIFKPFWDYHRGEIPDFQYSLDQSVKKANILLVQNKTAELLEIVLERLYTLRNQVFHGGATYKSKVNRQQVKDGASMLMKLIPIVVEIMVLNKDEDWGKINYPVVEQVRI